MIAKVFRQADSDETGTVDASIVPDLAARVIGSGVRESEMHLIRFKAESKAGKHSSSCSYVVTLWGRILHNGCVRGIMRGMSIVYVQIH